MIRCMLSESRLPKKLSADAARYAVHIRNRCPNAATGLGYDWERQPPLTKFGIRRSHPLMTSRFLGRFHMPACQMRNEADTAQPTPLPGPW